ncbi:MAG: HAMP domain-containing histidine kinase [Propionibacteriaceae bacterium]|nr:HAMP domain-containing histidine kinase [Propionibacteriaceae bacterium]
MTAGGVAALIGPTLFHAHLVEIGHSPDSPEIPHIEQAYLDASGASLLVAALVATGCALAVSFYVTRRIRRPLESLSRAAEALSVGQHEPLATGEGAGAEFDTVAGAFNEMADRLASSEQTRLRLLGDLAHELRTPLANIKAHLEAVDDGVTDWNTETRSLVLAEIDHLGRLAGDLNEVSRAEEGRVSMDAHDQPIGEIVRDVVDNQRPRYLSKAISLRIEGTGDTIVRVDPIRIGQALNNLLNNALRHTPGGGTVTIRIQDLATAQVSVEVTDTGDGISADQLPHVFDRFYRGDASRARDAAGSGVGLTIARALVEAHGGTLRASSAGPGRGAAFTLTLPRSRAEG